MARPAEPCGTAAPQSSVAVTVTAKARGLRPARRTVTVPLVVAAADATPTISNVHRPYAAGTPKVGWTLTANPGTWTPSDASFTYAWLADGAVVGSGKTFTPTEAHATQVLSLRVTAAKKGWTGSSRTVVVGEVGR